jgi:peptidoglycan/LPS O-acetylase OafA/YrhL
MGRVRGLDAIRAVCAFWVAISHTGSPPITAGIDKTTPIGWVIATFDRYLWNGPAAVIVFFVVSGFCIHYPFSASLKIPSLAEYGARRYLRICIPLIVVMLVSPYSGFPLSLLQLTVLWSLLAELVYYTLYPALLALRRRGVTFEAMFALSFVIALLLPMSRPSAWEYPDWGPGLNWVIGLPCWLLGCLLAERVREDRIPNRSSIWVWRVGVWMASILLYILQFHTPLRYPWTLNVFAVLVVMWLAREIRHYQKNEPSLWLERAGQWSYSLYLVHLPANAVFRRLAVPNLGDNLNWIVRATFILGCSIGFYFAVEYPSHWIARVVAQWLRTRRSTARPAEEIEAGFALGRIGEAEVAAAP